ncbi:hypothetical protein [Actinomadura nitritigenes]|uniref:hypothetical protein n=1 Tax=Actinomadura nitritigenes TaxID=134602 RepID=UPI003D8CC1DA
MRIPLPRPGHPSGARFVAVLSVLTAAIIPMGLVFVVAGAIAGRPAICVAGTLEALVGVVLFAASRNMAKVERLLAETNRINAENERRLAALKRNRRIAELERELGLGEGR